MDDDDAELAMLRQQRKDRLGAQAGTTRGELVREARESAVASTSGVPLQGSRPSVPSFLAADDDEGAEDASGLRQMFPMSFGKKSKHTAQESPHAATKRVTVGPQRPKTGMSIGPISMPSSIGAAGVVSSSPNSGVKSSVAAAAKAAAAAAAAESPGTVHGWDEGDRQNGAAAVQRQAEGTHAAVREADGRGGGAAELASAGGNPAPLVGPPRPPTARSAAGAATGATVGPPRPPTIPATPSGEGSNPQQVGPPRPAQQSTAQDGAASGPVVGPPRPRGVAKLDAGLVGPPRPPGLQQKAGGGDAAPMVGPRRPSQAASPVVGPPRPPGPGQAGPSQAVEIAVQHIAVETAAVPDIGKPLDPAEMEQRVAAGVSTMALADDAAPLVGPPRPGRTPPRMPPPKFSESTAAAQQPALTSAAQPVTRDGSMPAEATVNGAGVSEALASAPRREAEAAQEDTSRLPISNEVLLHGHYKAVSAIDVDRAGGRVLTGGMDYNVSIYDFNGMKADGKPFRELMPQDGHPVNAVSYSPSGDAFICITGEPRAKVYDRDGREKGEFKRGDMYLRDLKNTKGHVAGCTHGQWHPSDRHTAMTSSTDGTVRVWDCENIEQKMVIKPTTTGAGRVPVTACCYNADGTLIAAALTNGTIQLWSVTGDFGRSAALGVVPVPAPQRALFGKQTWKYASGAKQTLKRAHPEGVEVTDVRLLRDGHSLVSRAADDTCKLWDVRALRGAVHEWQLPLPHSHTRMCTSPQEDMLLTGVPAPDGKAGGMLVAVSLKPPYELVQQVGMPGPVTAVQWHPRINQILVGTGERAKGWTHVLYNPDMSDKGALLCAGKKPRQVNPFDYQPPMVIHTPGSLPMFRDDSWRKRKREPEAGEMRKAKNPDPGPTISGPGGGGKIGHTNNTLLTQYLLEKGGMQKLEEQIDPREAFLRHKDADKDLAAWTKAYEKTQPKKQFAAPEDEADDKK